MTLTSLALTAVIALAPLTASAKDVKGLNRAQLCSAGYKVGCPGQDNLKQLEDANHGSRGTTTDDDAGKHHNEETFSEAQDRAPGSDE